MWINDQLIAYQTMLQEIERTFEEQEENYNFANDIDARTYINLNRKLTLIAEFIKSHAAQILLNMAFSIIVG